MPTAMGLPQLLEVADTGDPEEGQTAGEAEDAARNESDEW